jgi:adenylylsulfate kinase-like enzyme
MPIVEHSNGSLENDPAPASTPTTPVLINKNNFVNWFRRETPLYWITRKPGSGKSTMMKYLYQHLNLCGEL